MDFYRTESCFREFETLCGNSQLLLSECNYCFGFSFPGEAEERLARGYLMHFIYRCWCSGFRNIIHMALQLQPYEIRVQFNERTAALNDEVLLSQLSYRAAEARKLAPVAVFHTLPLESEYADCKEVWGSISSLWFSTCAKSLVGIIVLSPCVIFAQV